MTREEHKTKIDEIIKENQTIKNILGNQNNKLSQVRNYVSADFEEAYQRGLNDAWMYARKIALNVVYEVSDKALRDAFDVAICYDIFIKYSVQEAIKKIDEYEKQMDVIKIGDEVRLNYDDTRAVVMDMSDQEDAWWIYTENGCIEEWHSSKFRKSGRTFPQIAEVLKAMQER